MRHADWVLCIWLDLLRCIVGGLMSSFAHGGGFRQLQVSVQLTIFWLFDPSWLQPMWILFIWVSQLWKIKLHKQQMLWSEATASILSKERHVPALWLNCHCSGCVWSFFDGVLAKWSHMWPSPVSRDKWPPLFMCLHAFARTQLPASVSHRFSCHKPAEQTREIWPKRHNYAAKKSWSCLISWRSREGRKLIKTVLLCSQAGMEESKFCPAVWSQRSCIRNTMWRFCRPGPHIKGAAWKSACGAWWEKARWQLATAFLAA